MSEEGGKIENRTQAVNQWSLYKIKNECLEPRQLKGWPPEAEREERASEQSVKDGSDKI
jgi:hypothetical protein